MRQRSESIEKIRKRFHREWLLIAIDKMDEATTTPLTGRLLAHSPHRDEVHRESLRRRGGRLLIDCTPDMLPAGCGHHRADAWLNSHSILKHGEYCSEPKWSGRKAAGQSPWFSIQGLPSPCSLTK